MLSPPNNKKTASTRPKPPYSIMDKHNFLVHLNQSPVFFFSLAIVPCYIFSFAIVIEIVLLFNHHPPTGWRPPEQTLTHAPYALNTFDGLKKGSWKLSSGWNILLKIILIIWCEWDCWVWWKKNCDLQSEWTLVWSFCSFFSPRWILLLLLAIVIVLEMIYCTFNPHVLDFFLHRVVKIGAGYPGRAHNG